MNQVSPAVLQAIGRATLCNPESLTVQQRTAMPHQANILYDVFGDGRHLIAKEFLSDVDLDSPLNEYRALRLVEPLDMAP